jgi:hypothetical protein
MHASALTWRHCWHPSGVLNLSRVRRHDGRRDDRSESSRRIWGESGEFAPRDESRRELFAIERSAQQMPLEREMLPDRSEARGEFLCAFRVTKATHSTLAFTRGLVAVFCAGVQPSGRFDEHVLHVRKLRDLGFRCRIAAQLIGDDLARYRVGAQHARSACRSVA